MTDNTVLKQLLRDSYYQLSQQQKQVWLLPLIKKQIEFHQQHCAAYGQFIQNQAAQRIQTFADVPFLLARVFKQHQLYSGSSEQLARELRSSGTSGQSPSRILLDKENARLQSHLLVKIMSEFLGKQRLPMLIIDQAPSRDSAISARQAGIQGFSMFGRHHCYALNHQGSLDWEALNQFTQQGYDKVLIFGFTFVLWQQLLQQLKTSKQQLDFDKAIVLHGGGWKHLQQQAISPLEFKQTCGEYLGQEVQVHDYYGMVEQTGNLYVECEAGFFHTTDVSEILIRDPVTLELLPDNQQGLIESISLSALSYPGHAILTEDLGVSYGVDCCRCGRNGRIFKVQGRMQTAENRGCSNVIGASA